MRYRLLLVLVAAVAVVGAACGPPPPTSAPDWVTTQIPRTVTPTATTNYLGAWTDSDWFATLEATVGSASPSASLLFHPRSGPGNSVLGAPQSVPISIDPTFAGPTGEDIVALPGSSAVEFFRDDAGTWSSIGTFAYPAGQRFLAANDDWLVLGSLPMDPGIASSVEAHPLDTTGPAIVVGPAQPILPDPSWSTGLQNGFGIEAAVDGDLLAVRAQDQFAGTAPGVRMFRAAGGTWTPEISLGGVPGGPDSLGQSMDVDDGATVDRLALQVDDPGPTPPRIDVYADLGAGFALEQSIVRSASEADASNGLIFGSEVALDGTLLAVSGRQVLLQSAEPGHADVKVTTVQIFRRGGTWFREAQVPLSPDPAAADTVSSGPIDLQARDNHVAAHLFVSPNPPPGCTFPCFIFGSEAWSIDRTN